MAEYDRFNARFRSICRNGGEKSEDEIFEDIHEEFVSCAPYLPDNLKHNAAHYFEEVCRRYEPGQRIEILGAKLLEMLYLFEEEYDRVEESFDEGEWEYIKDITAEFAVELDQQKLTYIMRHVVARGLLDR